MLVKLGVDISRLDRKIRRILPEVDMVYKRRGEEAVITSTYEGDHSVASLHYAHLAIDFRFPKQDPVNVTDELSEELGKNYDVVTSKNCIHIEWDPQ